MAQKRKDWNSLISGFKASDLVFLDESGCNTDMTRRYAYSLGGSRAVDSAPLSKPKNTTILSSIQLDGTLRYTTFSGGTTVERFKRYLETDLLPHLNENSVLIMDNMKSHHAKAVRNLLDSSGVRCIYAKFVSAAKDGADCFIDWMRGSLFGQVAGMAIFPSTLLGILPVGCLLYMHGTLSAETFLAVIVLSFGVIQPLITAFSYTDDIAQVTTIVGEVAKVLSGEDMQRPERAEKLPADNAVELKDVRFAYHDKEVLHGIDLHIAPGTVNALVGPSGSGKSTIARAIMKDAPIIILDEATANVDPENEKELMEAVAELTNDKTVIMIAHRLKTVRHADQIFVVDHGEIVQQGTHDELVAVDGLYRRFVVERQQAAGWKV